MKEKISFDEACEILLRETGLLDYENLETNEACGRVLAEDIFSKENVPPFDRSPYDGYALRSFDVKEASLDNPITLKITEEIPAGSFPQHRITAGLAAKILTGAPVPDGADLIVKFEDTDFDETSVTIKSPGKSGDNIVPKGEDIKEGELVLKKGTPITPPVCGILASLGLDNIRVYKKPVISIISTGSELVEINETPAVGQIRNNSAMAISTYLKSKGAIVRYCGIVRDDPEIISNAVQNAIENSDIVLTTGGVSVGDYDYMPNVCERIGAKKLFGRMKLKPGGAYLAAKKDSKFLICLSGNPAAAYISMVLTVIPVIKKISGLNDYMLKSEEAISANDFTKKCIGTRIIPAKAFFSEGILSADLSDKSGNGRLFPLYGCDCLARIDDRNDGIKKGEKIKIYFI